MQTPTFYASEHIQHLTDTDVTLAGRIIITTSQFGERVLVFAD